MSYIESIRNFHPAFRRIEVETPPLTRQPDLPPVTDREWTLFMEGISWKFTEGKVLIAGLDVEQLIANRVEDIGYWVGLAEGLTEYRKRLKKISHLADQLGHFEFVVEALLGKIMGRLKRVYDQKMSGLSWSIEDGQFILNGINIRSFLALYRVRKTDKARKFLRGLRGKLLILLENRQDSSDYERIRHVVEDLHEEINTLLSPMASEETSRSSCRLLALNPQLS